MKIYKKIGFIILALILFGGCDDKTETNNVYQYSGFDTLGVKIIKGSLTIEYGDSTDISGEWNFDTIGEPANIGPQTGTGEYTGTIANNELRINLNPEWVDNNVTLAGIIIGNNINGEWDYSGFPGTINHGTFTAEK